MFGDFFQRVGNFFTGSGWRNDDEEKKWKKQQPKPQQRQQQAQPQQPNRPQNNFFQNPTQPKNNLANPEVFNLKPRQQEKQAQPKPEVKQPELRINQPVIAPVKTEQDKREKQRQISAIVSGVKYRPKKNYLSKQEYEAALARKRQLDSKANPNPITTGANNFFGGIYDAIIKPAIQDPITKTINQMDVAIETNKRGGNKGVTSPELAKKYLQPYQADLKAGRITQQQYNELESRVNRNVKQNVTAREQAEKKTGVKTNQSEGVTSLLEFMSNFVGGELAVRGGKNLAQPGERVVREIADGASELAENTAENAQTMFQQLLQQAKDGRAIRREEKLMDAEREAGRGTVQPEAPEDNTPAFQRQREADRAAQEEFNQNPGDVTDIPAYQRQGRELPSDRDRQLRIDELQKQVDAMPSDEAIRVYEFNLRQKFAEDVRNNPQLEQQLREKLNFNLTKLGEDVARATRMREELDALKQTQADNYQQTKTAVNLQQEATEAAQKQQADEIAAAAEQRQQAVAPTDTGVTPQQATPDPEVQANDAYSTWDDIDATHRLIGTKDFDKGTKVSKVSKAINKVALGDAREWYKRGIDKINDGIADAQYKMAQSNAVASSPQRLATLFFNNAAVKDGIRQILRVRNDTQTAAGDAVKRLANKLKDDINKLPNVPEFNRRLDQIFESEEFLARKYGEGTPRLTPDMLTPEERAIFETLIDINKRRNAMLYRQGLIDEDEFQLFSNGMHSPRLYDFERQGLGLKGNKLIDTTATKSRKDLEQISDETFAKIIDSPVQRMLIRYEKALRSQASHDALKALDEAKMLRDDLPNNQFSRLEGSKWGKYQGKALYNPLLTQISGDMTMNTKTGTLLNDLLDGWRESKLGQADRFVKKTKTVYSPGTFIGNVFSNPLLFNRGAGVNPITQAVRMTKASADLALHRSGRTFDPEIYEAQKYGVFSSDTGKQITGESSPELSVTNKGSLTKVPEHIYGGVDDAAKLALWRTLRRRGEDPETAARRVSQFTQDYNNAGRLVRNLADSPVLGSPFARFAPELVRLAKNNLTYNPVGMIASVGALALIQDKLSKDANETPEERAAREDAVGQTKIPGTAWLNDILTGYNSDISLNFPVGDAAVNIARSVGLNFPIEPNGDPGTALVKALAPWAIPTRQNAQGDTVFAPEEVVSSMLFKPIAQQLANRDFMGREISDPENKTYYEGVGDNDVRKFSDELPQGKQTQNRLGQLFMSYVPLANEGNAITSAVMGEEDYYGKDRTIPQAIMRMFGIKATNNDEQAQQDRLETAQYFEEDLPATQAWLRENPDLTEKYWQLKDPSRNRITNQKTSDLVTPEKWDIINSDTSGRLFGFLKDQAIKNYQNDGRPLDPIYRLDDINSKYVAELRSRPSGDDIEAQEILRATTGWYPAYEDAYYKYLEDNQKYFDSQPEFEGAADPNPRVEEYGKISKPVEQPPIIKQYYQIKDQNPDAAKEFYRNNRDALSNAFDTYGKQRLDRINALRKIEGYEPISWETWQNETFGFDADGGRGYGRGYGYGGGGGGGRSRTVDNLGDLTNFANAVKRLEEINTNPNQNESEFKTLLARLVAGSGGGRQKPPFGASSRGET